MTNENEAVAVDADEPTGAGDLAEVAQVPTAEVDMAELEPAGEVVEPAAEPVADAADASTPMDSAIDAEPTGDVDVSSESARAIEAILMVADEPVTPQLLAELLEVRPSQVEALCAAIAERLVEERRGFVLVRTAGGYRFQSESSLAAYVERFVLDGQAARLSAAAMETLAIVAYKQPISRAQVAAIRGVNADAVMKTLAQRGYVAEIATDPGPGHATLFGTTALFLEKLGLDTIHELPPLGDLVPGADVMEVLEASLRVDGETGRPVRGPLARPGAESAVALVDADDESETAEGPPPRSAEPVPVVVPAEEPAAADAPTDGPEA